MEPVGGDCSSPTSSSCVPGLGSLGSYGDVASAAQQAAGAAGGLSAAGESTRPGSRAAGTAPGIASSSSSSCSTAPPLPSIPISADLQYDCSIPPPAALQHVQVFERAYNSNSCMARYVGLQLQVLRGDVMPHLMHQVQQRLLSRQFPKAALPALHLLAQALGICPQDVYMRQSSASQSLFARVSGAANIITRPLTGVDHFSVAWVKMLDIVKVCHGAQAWAAQGDVLQDGPQLLAVAVAAVCVWQTLFYGKH